MRVSSLTFRYTMKHRIFISFDQDENTVGYIVHGYIDENGRLKYAIEARITTYHTIEILVHHAYQFTYDEIKDCKVMHNIPIDDLTNEHLESFEDWLRKKYACSAALQKVRNNCRLDVFRDPNFPDVLNCYVENHYEKTIRVKSLYYDGNYLRGVIVDEMMHQTHHTVTPMFIQTNQFQHEILVIKERALLL